MEGAVIWFRWWWLLAGEVLSQIAMGLVWASVPAHARVLIGVIIAVVGAIWLAVTR